MACSTQCVFEEGGFLTADKTIDKDAVTKLFSKALNGDKDWGSVMPKVLDKCFSSYSTEVMHDTFQHLIGPLIRHCHQVLQ